MTPKESPKESPKGSVSESKDSIQRQTVEITTQPLSSQILAALCVDFEAHGVAIKQVQYHYKTWREASCLKLSLEYPRHQTIYIEEQLSNL